MISFFLDEAMTKPLAVATPYRGTGTRSSFILPTDSVWKLCVGEKKELKYTLDQNRLTLKTFSPPGRAVKIMALPENTLELKKLNSEEIKVYQSCVYMYTPAPQGAGKFLKVEHDYSEITSIKLSLDGGPSQICIPAATTAAGPWPITITVTMLATEDIRLFSDLQLCALSIENTTNTSQVFFDSMGRLNACAFPSGATQKRRIKIYEL